MIKKMQIDRLEEGFVVLADEEMRTLDLPKSFFSDEIHEGDLFSIVFEGETPVSATFLPEETDASKARTKSLMEKLRQKKKSGQ